MTRKSKLPTLSTTEEIPLPEPEPNMLAVIAKAVAENPQMNVDNMEKLLAMHERIVAAQQKASFFAAMARVAPQIPEIGQRGVIKNRDGHVQSKYATLDDIDRIIRPIISAEGLSQSFDSEMTADGKVRVSCRLSHAEGHSEVKYVTLPIDKSGSKNETQAVVSTVSYGRKCLTKMFFNIQEAGEDTDGVDPSTITDEQVKDLETAIAEYEMNLSRFLFFMGVGAIKDILARDWSKAQNAIDVQRQAIEAKRKV